MKEKKPKDPTAFALVIVSVERVCYRKGEKRKCVYELKEFRLGICK